MAGNKRERDYTYDDVIKRIEKRRVIVMSLLTAYNESVEPKNAIDAEIFMSLYDRTTDTLIQEPSRIRHDPSVTPKKYTAIGENIRNLHGMIDANNSITIDDEGVKNIFQEITRLMKDPMQGGAKRNNRKRNSSKRANKKKKTIKSKSKRRPRIKCTTKSL